MQADKTVNQLAATSDVNGCQQSLAGFAPRIAYDTREEFVAAAKSVAGLEWAKIDQDARLLIKSQLGYGPDRDNTINQYLGSRSS